MLGGGGRDGGQVQLAAHQLLHLEVAVVLLHHMGQARLDADRVRSSEIPTAAVDTKY